MRKNKVIGLVIKLIAIISSIYGIIKTYLGWMSFTYFTVLSNIFMLIMLAVFFIRDIIVIIKNKNIIYNNLLYITKFLATISITLTFLVFLTLLAPTIPGGIIYAYLNNGAGSLCVHFITPILAIIDFLLFDKEYKSNKKHTIYAIIPPLIYVLYVIILGMLGVRWGNMLAPYNFLNYGAKTGWFGFDLSIIGWESLGIGVIYMIIFLTLLFILLGRLFLFIQNNLKGDNYE